MARLSIKEAIIYGGATKEDYDSVRPLMAEENYRVWRLVSVILEVVFIGLFVFFLFDDGHKQYIAPIGILAGTMILFVLAFFVLLKPHHKALLPFIYASILIMFGVFIYIGVFLERDRPTVIFPVLMVGLSFLTLDRPLRYLITIVLSLASFLVLVCLFKTGADTVMSDILDGCIFGFAGILISLFISKIRMRDLILRKNAEQERDQDALTNVGNKLAYDRKVDEVNKKMHEPGFKFAVAIFDVNGLKLTNDTYGHDEGDKLLVRCCNLLQASFPHTPIYRIGGDEFAAIIIGEDYVNREKIIRELHEKINIAHEKSTSLLDDTSIAIGVAIYNSKRDRDYLSVFSRADSEMYDNKRVTKAKNKYLEEKH